MNWYVGSTNDLKIKAVRSFFKKNGRSVIVISKDVPSGVSDQPLTDEETMYGAINRAQAAAGPDSCSIGLEGGLVKVGDTWYVCNWGALVDTTGDVYVARGASIPLPTDVSDAVVDHKEELGDLLKMYAYSRGEKFEGGAIGYLTHGQVKREDVYEQIVSLLYGQLIYKEWRK